MSLSPLSVVVSTRCSWGQQISPLVPPLGELDETYAWFWFRPICSVMWKYNVIHKAGSTQQIALPLEKDEPQPYVTCTENLTKFGSIVFGDMRGDRQTHRQADNRNTSHPYRRRRKMWVVFCQWTVLLRYLEQLMLNRTYRSNHCRSRL